jgi:hypothetical protein
MSLVGNRHIEAADPGAVGTGYQWQNTTTGNLYERNTTNTSWILIGNVNEHYYGQLPTGGGVMSGAITGVSGWAPVDSPDFTTTAKLLGVNLATINDLASLETALNALITSKVDSAIASSSSTISINNNIVVSMGLAGPASGGGVTIHLPPPVFADGVTATPSQCFSVASLVAFQTPGSSIDGISITNGATSLEWVANAHNVGGGAATPVQINYLIVAIR